jgi:hypothetical protein
MVNIRELDHNLGDSQLSTKYSCTTLFELRLIDVGKIIDLNLGEHQHPSPVGRLPF